MMPQPTDKRDFSHTTTTFAYDGDGRRTAKTVDAATTGYVFDVIGGLATVLERTILLEPRSTPTVTI